MASASTRSTDSAAAATRSRRSGVERRVRRLPGQLAFSSGTDILARVGGAPAEPPHLQGVTERQVRGRAAAAVDVRVLRPAEWPHLRGVRLRALQDSPHAFASHYEREARWSEREWRSMFDSATWLIAGNRHNLVGLASSTAAERAWQRNIESVWVEPRHRRRGVTRLLLKELVRQEPAVVTELYAWVLDGNEYARYVYQRLGFELTGQRQPLPGSPGRIEERLVLRIGRGVG